MQEKGLVMQGGKEKDLWITFVEKKTKVQLSGDKGEIGSRKKRREYLYVTKEQRYLRL